MPKTDYETKPGSLVLSADRAGGLMAPTMLLNHVTHTKIYSDGKVVFIDPSRGSSEIYEGRLDARQIKKLFTLLNAHGFWNFAETYFKAGPTDLPTNIITATRRGEPEKRVGCYGGGLSAPPGFMECYQALLFPQIQPSDVKSYVRQPISDHDLAQGFYYAFEYQKKLNTPRDWEWVDAGRSSQWRRPEAQAHTVVLDSSYMIHPVDGCRHIRIRYSDDPVVAGSTILFDRNAMSPNEFGDIGITTLMSFTPQPATFALLQTAGDKRLFSIAMENYAGPKLRLVVRGDLTRPIDGRLLVLNTEDVIQDIHSLQRLP